jgi:hypothetical protein
VNLDPDLKIISENNNAHFHNRLHNCGYAVEEQHFFQKVADLSSGLLRKLYSCAATFLEKVAEVLPSNCGIALADIKKVTCAHICEMGMRRCKNIDTGHGHKHRDWT